ncbi:sensor histidine kinase [Pseudarthrobacter sp. J1763]|uniref:sensor histidine kinase n=1 Tax=Pseudarthrobacter sp. J1763 TaxID=3420445 RepID=UPI003D283A0A
MRVFLSQLPLSIGIACAILIAAAANPKALGDPFVMTGILTQILLLAATLAVPWHRLTFGLFLIIPVFDFLSLAVIRLSGSDTLNGVAALTLFPVFWLAASGLSRRIALPAIVLGSLMVVWSPLVFDGNTLTTAQLLRPLLLPVIFLGLGVAASTLVASMEKQQMALKEKDRQLVETLGLSQKREQLLNAIMNTVNVGLVAVDADGNDILMNRKQRDFHRLALPPDARDAAEEQLLVFESDQTTPIPPAERPVRRAINGDYVSETLMWLGNGSNRRAVSSTSRAIKDTDGTVTGSVVAFYDVTEVMLALQAKDDFVSNVSHELRTPLTSILGYLSLAMEESTQLPKHLAAYLQVAERNGERLLNLVSDLLATATPAVGLHRQLADLSELVELSVDSASPRATANNVVLLNQSTTPAMAVFDVGRIGQVVDNLVSNAIKYSPDGGVVTVTTFSTDSEVGCRVADTGLGMEAADVERLFTKFFRAKSATDRAIPGVGLGLRISKGFVDSHGGTIEVQSSPGQGSVFTVRLPVDPDAGTSLPAEP